MVSEGNISVNLSGFGQRSVIALAALHVTCPVFDSSKPLGTWLKCYKHFSFSKYLNFIAWLCSRAKANKRYEL